MSLDPCTLGEYLSGMVRALGKLSPTLAAVDLGSNSFHLVIAQVHDGALHIVDRLRQPVRLAAGLQANGNLDVASRRRAVACLRLFGHRLRGVERVRAVGTNTLRVAKNASAFLAQAQKILGHPIEIIPGPEEARLVYLGASHSVAGSDRRRLVVDIGGGSTECIIGEHFDPLQTDSLDMGCVTYTMRFFRDGQISAKRFRKAKLAASRELQSLLERYRALGWDRAIGSSGTLRAVAGILRANRWSANGMTPAGLRRVEAALIATKKITALRLKGLDNERRAVFPGGLAIVSAVFEQLRIGNMLAADGALREGLLYDLLGRMRHEDPRELTIQRLCERYAVDGAHAARIERTALQLLRPIAEPLGLNGEYPRQLLSWAARLHEVGLAIAYSGYHKHGAYLVLHSQMPGFSRDDKAVLAALIASHRRRLRRPPFAALPGAQRELAEPLAVLLRLAVLLHRGRTPVPAAPIVVRREGKRWVFRFKRAWLVSQPLTHENLREEAQHLAKFGMELRIVA